jgi:integrase/recombinase XerC
MNYMNFQIGGLSGLGDMIAENNLKSQLAVFLLSCKVSELSPRTIGDYEQKVGYFVLHCSELGITDPGAVTTNHVRLFLLKLQGRCNAVSVHSYFGCVKRFLNWLVSEGVIESNPMKTLRSPRVPRKIIRPFLPEDVKHLLARQNDNILLGARNKAIILIFLDTGLRLSEMASIQLKDIDFDRGIIKIMGKGARERVVGLGREAQKAMLRYLLMRRGDGLRCLWVTEEHKPMKARGIQTMIRRLGKQVRIENARCSAHTFRHTFSTWALLNGATEREVQSLLGHSSQRMTQQYTATINSEQAVMRHKKFSPADSLREK